MITLTSELSTPQVFFNSLHIGSLNELKHLFNIYIEEGKHLCSKDAAISDNSNNCSSSNNIILERLSMSVLNQSPPNHESKLRLPSQKHTKYHQELQVEYESWVERLKANEYFTLRHASGEEQLSICEVTKSLQIKLPSQNHFEHPMSFHKIHTKCFKGKDLFSVLKKEYPFLQTDEDTVAFAQTLLDLGIIHDVILGKRKSNKSSVDSEEATIDNIKFELGGIFRIQPFNSPHVLNKFRLWTKICIVDGHDPQPLMTLNQLSKKLQSTIAKKISKDRSIIDFESLRRDPDFDEFERTTCLLQLTNLDNMHEKARFAFFINLYNLMVKHAIILQQYSPTKSIFYSKVQYMVGKYLFSLDDIYHGILRCNAKHPKTNRVIFSETDERNKFKCTAMNPRIHFALISNYLNHEGDNIGLLTDPFECHREAVNGELFVIAHQRCKADDRIIVDDRRDILSLPNFIRTHLHDFISHWNGFDNEFPVIMSKFLIGEKREILEQMIRKTNRRETKRRVSVTFSDDNNAMSLHRGLGCLPFKCAPIVKSNKFGAFPQTFPEDELQLLDEENDYFDPEVTMTDFDDESSQSSSYIRDIYMSSAWDNFSAGGSSWSLSLKSIDSFVRVDNEPKTPNHSDSIHTMDKITSFPSTPNNKVDGQTQSPSNTVKTASTTKGSPFSSSDHGDTSSATTPDEISGDLVLPDFPGDDQSFDETNSDDDLSEDSSCSGPPKAKRVEKSSLFDEDVKEADNVKTTKEIINLFFPQTLNETNNFDDDGEKSYFSNDDGLSYESQSFKNESCASLLSRDTQFEKLFNSSMASI